MYLLLINRFKRCPSNRVLVIYGKVGGGNTSKCIHGGAAFVVPVIQDYDWPTLEPMQIEIRMRDALSIENIRVSARPQRVHGRRRHRAGRHGQRGDPPARVDARADHEAAQDIIFGQLRQVIASMRIEDINRDREAFAEHPAPLEPELRRSASC